MNKEVLEVLKAGRALISKPENWTQGANARDAQDYKVSYNDPTASAFCSNGAIIKVAFDEDFISLPICNIFAELVEGFEGVHYSTFNDTHTHAEVLAVWDKAIAKLEEELASV